MVPDASGDFAVAVVAILGIVTLTISTVMSVSSIQSRRTRAKLVSTSGLVLAAILFGWAVARSAAFIRL